MATARFLAKHLCDGTFVPTQTVQIQGDIDSVIAAGKDENNGAYVHEKDDSYSRLTDRVVEWCRLHPEPIPHTVNPQLKR